jgi:hypothetical protein
MESFNLNEYLSIRSAVERIGNGGGGGTSQSPQLIGAISQYEFPTINNIPDTETFIIPGFSITFTPTVNGYVDCNGAFTVKQDQIQNPLTIDWQLTSIIYDNGVAVPDRRFVSLVLTSPPPGLIYATLPFTLTAPVVAGHTYIIRPEVFAKNVSGFDSIFAGKMSVLFYPNATPLTPS